MPGSPGEDEAAMVTELCIRAVALGLPLARSQVFIDTLLQGEISGEHRARRD
jgi:hypothetical protein